MYAACSLSEIGPGFGGFDWKPNSVSQMCVRAVLESRPAREAWSSTVARRESEAIVMSVGPPLQRGVHAAAFVYGWCATPEAESFANFFPHDRREAALPVSLRPFD